MNHSRSFAELGGGVFPNIGAVGFLCARNEHLQECFMGMNNLLAEYHIAQRVDQRLQLYSRHTIAPVLGVESPGPLD